MISVPGGLGAATAWAIATLTAARASPLIGAPSMLAWVMLTGLFVVGPVALVEGRPESLHGVALVSLPILVAGRLRLTRRPRRMSSRGGRGGDPPPGAARASSVRS